MSKAINYIPASAFPNNTMISRIASDGTIDSEWTALVVPGTYQGVEIIYAEKIADVTTDSTGTVIVEGVSVATKGTAPGSPTILDGDALSTVTPQVINGRIYTGFSATRYMSLDCTPTAADVANADSSNASNGFIEKSWRAPSAGILSNLGLTVNNAPGVSQPLTITVHVNGSATSITATITGATDKSGSDTTHTANVVAGDLVCYKIAPGGFSDWAGGVANISFAPTATSDTTGTLINQLRAASLVQGIGKPS